MKQRALGAAATLAIVAGVASAALAQPAATKVGVRLKEFRVLPARSHTAPGKVTFVVRNVGAIKHEFVVLRTKIAAGKLPTVGTKAKEIGRVGKIAPFAPGQTRRLTLTLKAGRYVLLCNLPGHYKAGQFASFKVP
jgi:uncharacterized cupredoxin-like copper-binding protein